MIIVRYTIYQECPTLSGIYMNIIYINYIIYHIQRFTVICAPVYARSGACDGMDGAYHRDPE